MAVLPAADIILSRARAGGGRQVLSFSRKVRAHAEQRTPRKNSLQTRREAERREAHQTEAASKDAARALSPVFPLREDRGRLDLKNGAGALAFRRPTAASEVFTLGSAQAALPGTTGCKREDPLRHQCSEHLAVRHAPDGTMPKPPVSAVYRRAHENRSRSALRSTLAKGVLRERDVGNVTVMGTAVKDNVSLLGTHRRAD